MTDKGGRALTGSRDKILSCARELFHRGGYHTTSVDDILKRCGVAKSNFYYHFKAKEDLAIAVLEIEIQDYETRVARSLGDLEARPSERLERFFDEIKRSQLDPFQMVGCPFGNFAATLPDREWDERAERFRTRLSRLFQEMESGMCACIAAGVERGEFRRDIPAAELACSIIAAVQGLMLLTKTHKDIRPLHCGLTVMVRLIKLT